MRVKKKIEYFPIYDHIGPTLRPLPYIMNNGTS